MTGFTSKVQEVLKLITQGFERTDDDDVFTDLESEQDQDTLETDGSLALEQLYGSTPNRSKNSDFKVVNHPNFRGYEVIVSEPRCYDESVSIVKHLKDKKTIILNLQLLDKDQALRIVDFLCGATHALGGNQQKISDAVFIFTPSTVALSADSQKKKIISDGVWCQPQ